MLLTENIHLSFIYQDPIAREVINTNPGLKINPGFHLAYNFFFFTVKANFKLMVKESLSPNYGTKIFLKSLH